ncbi:MAG: DegT/DnrJ/EryC1/StrS family aminotransferase [Armatimonadetes bacterium]|nr:DegT/DnrJ/EryC1/StrS family aminotransferase [Armatimonadota bacterium]
MRPVPAIPMPLGWRDVVAACLQGPGALAEFEEACRQYHGVRRAFAVSSGRLALYIALRALRRLRPDATTVVLSAYTCPTVGRAVLEAGLTGLCVDVSLDDFNLDVEQVEAVLKEDVLAVVVAHMFGTPANIVALQQLCQTRGVYLVEDVAQACGARFDGRLVGTFGELAFLSLGRSKNLRGYKGGVLLVNDPALVGPVVEEVERLPQGGWLPPAAIVRQLAISMLSHPTLWQVGRTVPWLRVGAEDQSFDRSPSRMSAWQAGLGMLALSRLDAYNAHRQRLGSILEQHLACVPAIRVQSKPLQAQSVYTRLALRLVEDNPPRDKLVASLQRTGIDARAFYTRAMYEYDWWQRAADQARCPNAEQIVTTNLVLPLYWAMAETDLPSFVAGFHAVFDGACYREA